VNCTHSHYLRHLTFGRILRGYACSGSGVFDIESRRCVLPANEVERSSKGILLGIKSEVWDVGKEGETTDRRPLQYMADKNLQP